MSTPVEQAQVDKVAQAICDQRWGIDGEVHSPTGWDRDTARAVIEALQLTEEHDTEAHFEEVAESPYSGHKRFAGRHKITRLVGPWRAAGEAR